MECKLLSGVMQDTIISQNTRYLHIIVLEMVETLEVDLKFIVIDILIKPYEAGLHILTGHMMVGIKLQ